MDRTFWNKFEHDGLVFDNTQDICTFGPSPVSQSQSQQTSSYNSYSDEEFDLKTGIGVYEVEIPLPQRQNHTRMTSLAETQHNPLVEGHLDPPIDEVWLNGPHARQRHARQEFRPEYSYPPQHNLHLLPHGPPRVLGKSLYGPGIPASGAHSPVLGPPLSTPVQAKRELEEPDEPPQLQAQPPQPPPEKKKTASRRSISKYQAQVMQTSFDANPRPDKMERERLVELTGLKMRNVQIWFQNRRAKAKLQANAAKAKVAQPQPSQAQPQPQPLQPPQQLPQQPSGSPDERRMRYGTSPQRPYQQWPKKTSGLTISTGQSEARKAYGRHAHSPLQWTSNTLLEDLAPICETGPASTPTPRDYIGVVSMQRGRHTSPAMGPRGMPSPYTGSQTSPELPQGAWPGAEFEFGEDLESAAPLRSTRSRAGSGLAHAWPAHGPAHGPTHANPGALLRSKSVMSLPSGETVQASPAPLGEIKRRKSVYSTPSLQPRWVASEATTPLQVSPTSSPPGLCTPQTPLEAVSAAHAHRRALNRSRSYTQPSVRSGFNTEASEALAHSEPRLQLCEENNLATLVMVPQQAQAQAQAQASQPQPDPEFEGLWHENDNEVYEALPNEYNYFDLLL